MQGTSQLPSLLNNHEAEILELWMREQIVAMPRRMDATQEAELRRQGKDVLAYLRQAVQEGNLSDVAAPEWEPVRELLADIARARARKGFSPSETATFVFSLKSPLFTQLRQQSGRTDAEIAHEGWAVSLLIDKLGLHVMEIFQKAREETIQRQQQEMLELSTPVVKLWDGILALPLIGTLDSARTQVMMESLLAKIVETGCEIAILDITGVLTVDTLVAQHLLKTVAAARLMGADCIISGIRPQIAQTIVHLGVDLSAVTTKATMAEAFQVALRRQGTTLVRPTGRV